MIILKNFGAYLVTINRVSLKLSQVFAKDTRTTPIPKNFDSPGFEEWNNYFLEVKSQLPKLKHWLILFSRR